MKNWFQSCRTHCKLGALSITAACFLTASAAISAAAVPVASCAPACEAVTVYVNGIPYPGSAFLYEDVTYVELSEWTKEVYPCTLTWDAATSTASFTGEGIVMHVTDGALYLEANGRYLFCANGVFASGAGVYVPLRAAAKALGATVEWNEEEFAAYTATGGGPILSGDAYYAADEVLWLSRIIHAEAGAEPFYGQIAVGSVVMNRVSSGQFPDTIYGVIFDTRYGVQFTPIANGMIYREADEEAVIAAKICLDGGSVSGDILYFLNPAAATNFWVPNNRPYVTTIGGHDFYA